MVWQWHQLVHVVNHLLLASDKYASTSSLFLQAKCSSGRVSNSVKVKAQKAYNLPRMN